MNEQTLRQAQEYHQQQRQKRRLAREKLRQQCYEQVYQAIRRLAPNYPAIQAVYLFGSLTRLHAFSAQSDIDIAISSDDLTEESQFWQALEAELEQDVDLRPYRGAVAWAVDNYGTCVYERETSGSGA